MCVRLMLLAHLGWSVFLHHSSSHTRSTTPNALLRPLPPPLFHRPVSVLLLYDSPGSFVLPPSRPSSTLPSDPTIRLHPDTFPLLHQRPSHSIMTQWSDQLFYLERHRRFPWGISHIFLILNVAVSASQAISLENGFEWHDDTLFPKRHAYFLVTIWPCPSSSPPPPSLCSNPSLHALNRPCSSAPSSSLRNATRNHPSVVSCSSCSLRVSDTG